MQFVKKQKRAGRPPKNDWPDTPWYWMAKFKHTERPKPCSRCGQNAYYYYQEYLCAPHLLDLCNLGEVHWKWDEYPEVWARTEMLLRRPQKSTGAKNAKKQG